MMLRKGTAQITRRQPPRLLYTTGPQGATHIGHTHASYSLPPIPEVPDSQMESPTYSQSSCDTSETHWSAGASTDGRGNDDHLHLLVKDTKLQLYFMRMERELCTCPPAAIDAEVVKLTREIMAKPTEVGTSIQTAAETVARAGYRKVEYSRSCALLAYEIFYQLGSVSDDASGLFRDHLIGTVMKVFEGHYLNVFTLSFSGRVPPR